jgi:hypothetical protein
MVLIQFTAFSDMGKRGHWWSSSDYGFDMAWYRGVYNSIYGEVSYTTKRNGYSIRCIKGY